MLDEEVVTYEEHSFSVSQSERLRKIASNKEAQRSNAQNDNQHLSQSQEQFRPRRSIFSYRKRKYLETENDETTSTFSNGKHERCHEELDYSSFHRNNDTDISASGVAAIAVPDSDAVEVENAYDEAAKPTSSNSVSKGSFSFAINTNTVSLHPDITSNSPQRDSSAVANVTPKTTDITTTRAKSLITVVNPVDSMDLLGRPGHWSINSSNLNRSKTKKQGLDRKMSLANINSSGSCTSRSKYLPLRQSGLQSQLPSNPAEISFRPSWLQIVSQGGNSQNSISNTIHSQPYPSTHCNDLLTRTNQHKKDIEVIQEDLDNEHQKVNDSNYVNSNPALDTLTTTFSNIHNIASAQSQIRTNIPNQTYDNRLSQQSQLTRQGRTSANTGLQLSTTSSRGVPVKHYVQSSDKLAKDSTHLHSQNAHSLSLSLSHITSKNASTAKPGTIKYKFLKHIRTIDADEMKLFDDETPALPSSLLQLNAHASQLLPSGTRPSLLFSRDPVDPRNKASSWVELEIISELLLSNSNDTHSNHLRCFFAFVLESYAKPPKLSSSTPSNSSHDMPALTSNTSYPTDCHANTGSDGKTSDAPSGDNKTPDATTPLISLGASFSNTSIAIVGVLPVNNYVVVMITKQSIDKTALRSLSNGSCVRVYNSLAICLGPRHSSDSSSSDNNNDNNFPVNSSVKGLIEILSHLARLPCNQSAVNVLLKHCEYIRTNLKSSFNNSISPKCNNSDQDHDSAQYKCPDATNEVKNTYLEGMCAHTSMNCVSKSVVSCLTHCLVNTQLWQPLQYDSKL